MSRVGILLISYGSRCACMAECLKRSDEYDVRLYIADKQRNPLNVKLAEEHRVIPDLSVEKIADFALEHCEKIDFGIVGPEDPIIHGIRDHIEQRTKIPMVCPTKRFALEGSKVRQRMLLQEVAPEVNPKFKVFDPSQYGSEDEVRNDLFKWLDELNNNVAVKPDTPATGKGVGVWGDHFTTREDLWNHFLSIYRTGGKVIVEEKIDGEESSFQAFCDGKRISPLPETRDYKRAFDGDRGPNTGGMGSYKDHGDILPFMSQEDREREIRIVERIFRKLDGGDELRGMPFYVAFIHAHDGPKILEINSRPGDPEIMNILPILRDDFVDLCFRMIDGRLGDIRCDDLSTVVTYKVPMTYGGKDPSFSGDSRIDLSGAYRLREKYGDCIRIYPGSAELRDGEIHALKSRAVAVVGISERIEDARRISLEGINMIRGNLWNRNDIASREHIQRSISHMRALRCI